MLNAATATSPGFFPATGEVCYRETRPYLRVDPLVGWRRSAPVPRQSARRQQAVSVERRSQIYGKGIAHRSVMLGFLRRNGFVPTPVIVARGGRIGPLKDQIGCAHRL